MLNITEDQYRNNWVNAEREFAINSFSSMSWILQTREAEKALDEAKKRGKMFCVKVRMIKEGGKLIPRNALLKEDKIYDVLEVHKYKEKDGGFVTNFLLGDKDTGEMIWIPAASVFYVSD